MLVPVCVSYRRARYSSHGWLTPAALVARRRFGEKCAICNAHTSVRKSGGREPAVVCDTNALLRESSNVWRLANTQPRAAGVSPPWCAIRTRCCESRAMFGDWRTHNQERRASARRVLGPSNDVCGLSQITCKRVPQPTAGSRHPLLVADADAFAGVSFIPASTLLIARLAYASRSWSETRMPLLVCVSYPRVRWSSHGWLTPAAPVARRRFGEKCEMCNAHTNVR
jgi:hypothetical protein